jgi:PKD repeat protein
MKALFTFPAKQRTLLVSAMMSLSAYSIAQPPVADFSATNKKIGAMSTTHLTNLSTGAPFTSQWSITPACNACMSPPYFPNMFSSATATSPDFIAGDPGFYTICLKVTNSSGSDSTCKTNYIKVLSSYFMCSGSGALVAADSDGVVFSPSGPYVNYTRPLMAGCTGILIKNTCIACVDSIKLLAERVKLLPGDTLLVKDSTSTGTTLIKKVTAASSVVVRSGHMMKIEYKAGTSVPPPGADTFAWTLRWAWEGVPMPVKWLSFTGHLAGEETVSLNWSTASETDNHHFEIERNVRYGWENTGIVKSSGNGQHVQAYSFTDRLPADREGAVFYRIRQVDNDGKFSYSAIIAIETKPVTAEVAVQPNPFAKDFTISDRSGIGHSSHIQLTDIHGKTLLDEYRRMEPFGNIVIYPELNTPGIYLLKVDDKTIRVMKD